MGNEVEALGCRAVSAVLLDVCTVFCAIAGNIEDETGVGIGKGPCAIPVLMGREFLGVGVV